MSKKNVINNEKKSIGDVAVVIFRLISLIIIIVCLLVLYKWHQNNMENNSIIDELGEFATLEDNSEDTNEESTEESVNEESFKLSVNFNELKAQNPDTVAWVRVNNTNIDFPVVKASDNNYYLKRNFKKQSNGAGWIFADYRNSFDTLDKNTIVYGHNRRNGSMFSNLSQFVGDSWNFENENSYFYFATENASYKAEIFSVYMMKASKLTIPNNFSDEADFQNYVQGLKGLSIRDFNVEVSNLDNIVTLCTCDNTNQNRIVVHAKLVEQ